MNKKIIIMAIFLAVLIGMDIHTGSKIRNTISRIKQLRSKRNAPKNIVPKKKLTQKTSKKSHYQKMRESAVKRGLNLVNTLKNHKKKLLLAAGAYATSDTWSDTLIDKLIYLLGGSPSSELEVEPLFGWIPYGFKDDKVKIASHEIEIVGEDFSVESYETNYGLPFYASNVLKKNGKGDLKKYLGLSVDLKQGKKVYGTAIVALDKESKQAIIIGYNFRQNPNKDSSASEVKYEMMRDKFDRFLEREISRKGEYTIIDRRKMQNYQEEV